MLRSLLVVVVLALIAPRPAAAQAPGSPLQPGCPPQLTLTEPPVENGQESILFPFPPGCGVFAGSVILIEDPTKDPLDPHNWSDVAVFFTPGQPPLPGSPAQIVAFVSDPAENGISDADLAAAGVPVTVAFILGEPNNAFLRENPLGVDNVYPAVSPAGQIIYDFQSDPPEPPTPVGRTSWGSLKSHYR